MPHKIDIVYHSIQGLPPWIHPERPNLDHAVIDYGAVGDGKTLDTKAIQTAIDQAHASNGGRVILAAGKTYLSGSLLVRANVELVLEEGSKLLASSDYGDYSPQHQIQIITAGKVAETVLPNRAFIAGFQAHNFKISGLGEINGNADGFIETRGQYIHEMKGPVGGRSQYLERPFTIFLIESQNVELREFTLRDPAFWALRTTGCNDLLIDSIKILTDLMVPNADGIDIDRCSNVTISNCHLVTADDAISLKSCSETSVYGDVAEITISNCYMKSTSGAITLGTESVGDIHDVLVTNCKVEGTHRGFAVRAREGGGIYNVLFKDSKLQTRAFSPMWWGHGEALHVTAFAWNKPENLGSGNPERILKGKVRNIRFENLEVTTEAGILNWAQEQGLIKNIEYKNVNVLMSKESKWPARIDLRPNDVVPVVERSHNALEIVNVDGLSVIDSSVIWDDTRNEYLNKVNQENSINISVDGFQEVN